MDTQLIDGNLVMLQKQWCWWWLWECFLGCLHQEPGCFFDVKWEQFACIGVIVTKDSVGWHLWQSSFLASTSSTTLLSFFKRPWNWAWIWCWLNFFPLRIWLQDTTGAKFFLCSISSVPFRFVATLRQEPREEPSPTPIPIPPPAVPSRVHGGAKCEGGRIDLDIWQGFKNYKVCTQITV